MLVPPFRFLPVGTWEATATAQALGLPVPTEKIRTAFLTSASGLVQAQLLYLGKGPANGSVVCLSSSKTNTYFKHIPLVNLPIVPKATGSEYPTLKTKKTNQWCPSTNIKKLHSSHLFTKRNKTLYTWFVLPVTP